MLASLGHRWLQHITVRGLQGHCIVTDVVALDKLSLYQTFSYARQSPPVPFKLCRRQFPIKISFSMTISKAQGQTLNPVAVYLPSPVFPHGQLYVAFSLSSTFDNIAFAVIEGPLQRIINDIDNINLCISRSFKYMGKSVVIKYFVCSTSESFAWVHLLQGRAVT